MGGTENTNDEEQEPIRVNTREEFDDALERTASLLARPRAWLRHETRQPWHNARCHMYIANKAYLITPKTQCF